MNNEADRSQRKALGKGLSALLPNRPVATNRPAETAPPSLPDTFDDFQSIPLAQIQPGTDQPRDIFDTARLMELAQSITANGLLQPITVQKHPDGKYRIIAGERRWRACQMAGLTEIPALVRKVEHGKGLELALIENIQREDLNPMEIANAYYRLATEHGLSHEDIAQRTGKERSTVTNFLRLLKLGYEARNELKSDTISMGHARALLNITDEARQNAACREVIARKLSVRETEAYVRQLTRSPDGATAAKPEKEPPPMDPNIRAALDDMAMALGTKVTLTPRKLEIEYYSQEDLDRIYSVIVKQ